MKTQYKISRDKNGNKIVKVSRPGLRSFSIQTNGNLPKTHRDGVGEWTAGEVGEYVQSFGTEKQKGPHPYVSKSISDGEKGLTVWR